MGVKFSNNGHSTLAASITSTDTSITVASGHGARFPSLGAGDYFYATLIDASNNLEIVKCTARSSDVLTVTRGQESTTARAYAIADRIELRVTSQGITDATDIDSALPSQTSNSGKYLTTDGTNSSWGTVNQYSLPSQTGNSGKVLTTDGTNESWGDGGKIKAMDRFALTGLSVLSATSAETYFWSVTYNRQTNGDLWIVSDIPASELPNGPYVGPHLQIVCGGTTIRASRGLKWFRPNTDNTELGFNSYFTAAELGSFTGNITIKHGWNWGGATSSTQAIGYVNLGYAASGTPQKDNRVPNAGNTEGHMMVMEF